MEGRSGDYAAWVRMFRERAPTEGTFYILWVTDRCFKIGITQSQRESAEVREKSFQDGIKEFRKRIDEQGFAYDSIWNGTETPPVVRRSPKQLWDLLKAGEAPNKAEQKIVDNFQEQYAIYGPNRELFEQKWVYSLEGITLKPVKGTDRWGWFKSPQSRTGAAQLQIGLKSKGDLSGRLNAVKGLTPREQDGITLKAGTLCRIYAQQLFDLEYPERYSKRLYCYDVGDVRVIDSNKEALKKTVERVLSEEITPDAIRTSMALPLVDFEVRADKDTDKAKLFWLAGMPEKGVVPTSAFPPQLCHFWFLDKSMLDLVEKYVKQTFANFMAGHMGLDGKEMEGVTETVIGLTFTQVKGVVNDAIEFYQEDLRDRDHFVSPYKYTSYGEIPRQFPWFAELQGGRVKEDKFQGTPLGVQWFAEAVRWADTYTLRQWLEMGWIGQKGHTCAQDPWRGLVDAFQFKLRF